MSEPDEIRRELEEIRRLREELRQELDAVRREREALKTLREETIERAGGPPEEPPAPPGPHRRDRPGPPPPHRPPRVRGPRPPHPPHPPHRRVIDLDALAESLEDMMAGLGEQIRSAVESVATSFERPVVLHHPPRRAVRRSTRRKIVESIPPERISRVIGPLGNVERLRILNFLMDGGKTFNEIETYTGKTGSSLTHHLNPLLDAGYIVKGQVRGTYYITVTGRLAYRLAQWLTSQVEREQGSSVTRKASDIEVEFEDEDEYPENEDAPSEDDGNTDPEAT